MSEPRAPFGRELFLTDIRTAKEVVDLVQGVPVYADADREPLGVQIQRARLDEADNAVLRCVVDDVIIGFYRTWTISVCIIEILRPAGDDKIGIFARIVDTFPPMHRLHLTKAYLTQNYSKKYEICKYNYDHTSHRSSAAENLRFIYKFSR